MTIRVHGSADAVMIRIEVWFGLVGLCTMLLGTLAGTEYLKKI